MGKLRFLLKAETTVELGVTVVGAVVVAVMMMITVIDVFLRKVFDGALPGSYEYVSLLFVGVVFLGLAYAQAQDQHIKVPVFFDRIPPKFHRPILGLIFLIALLLFGTTAWFSAIEVVWAQQAGETVIGAKAIPTWWSRAFIPVGTGLLSIRLLIQIVRVATGKQVFEDIGDTSRVSIE